jgi:hypothetical protein
VCAPVRLHRLHSFVGYFKLEGNKITLNDLCMYPDGVFLCYLRVNNFIEANDPHEFNPVTPYKVPLPIQKFEWSCMYTLGVSICSVSEISQLDCVTVVVFLYRSEWSSNILIVEFCQSIQLNFRILATIQTRYIQIIDYCLRNDYKFKYRVEEPYLTEM